MVTYSLNDLFVTVKLKTYKYQFLFQQGDNKTDCLELAQESWSSITNLWVGIHIIVVSAQTFRQYPGSDI